MTEPTTPALSIVTDFKDATPGRYLADAFVDGEPSGWTVVVVHADGHQTFEPPDQSEAAYARIPHEPHEAIALPDRWEQVAVCEPEAFVHLTTEEEADPGYSTFNWTETMKDNARQAAQDLADHYGMSLEEAAAAIVRTVTGEADSHEEHFIEGVTILDRYDFAWPPVKRPLPRHRPPKIKDPDRKVATRLPPNVFGAPRAVR